MITKTRLVFLLLLVLGVGFVLFYISSTDQGKPADTAPYLTEVSPTLNDLFKSLLNIDSSLDVSPLYYKIDLNKDDQPEYIAVVDDTLFCGSLGCMHAIFIEEDNRWRVTNVIYAQAWALAKSQTKGYQDLIIDEERRWVWTGSDYGLAPGR
jgi:hypothetical protein